MKLSSSIVSLLLGVAALAAAVEKPNILFILADDLGRQDIGVHGSTFHQTPNIDRLAKDGIAQTQDIV